MLQPYCCAGFLGFLSDKLFCLYKKMHIKKVIALDNFVSKPMWLKTVSKYPTLLFKKI